MNRTQLRRMIAEVQERSPDVAFTLHARPIEHPNLTRRHLRVDVTVRVTRSLYFDPQLSVSDETGTNMLQEEVEALRFGTTDYWLDVGRAEYLRSRAQRSPTALRLLQGSPLPLWDPNAPVPEHIAAALHATIQTRLSRRAHPQIPPLPPLASKTPDPPVPLPEALRRLEALARPAQPPTSAAAPEARVPAPAAPEPEAMTLWERLEDDAPPG